MRRRGFWAHPAPRDVAGVRCRGFRGFRGFRGLTGLTARGLWIAASRCTANTFCRSVSDAQNVVSRFPFRGNEFIMPPVSGKTVKPRLRHRSGDLLESPFMCRPGTNRPTWRPSAGSPHGKCTPSVACGDVSPGGGDFSSMILCGAHEAKS